MKTYFEKRLYDEGRAIREEIFRDEQKFSTEFDEIDDTCWHLLITEDDGKGIAVASADYRMYPSAKYPDFIEDAAEAVHWVSENIGRYGNCKKLFRHRTSVERNIEAMGST